jgi:hypothetical protein
MLLVEILNDLESFVYFLCISLSLSHFMYNLSPKRHSGVLISLHIIPFSLSRLLPDGLSIRRFVSSKQGI